MIRSLRAWVIKGTVVAAILCATALPCRAQTPLPPDFRVTRAAQPPKIDGLLDDAAWQEGPLRLGDWLSYNPLRGESGSPQTDVFVTYDERNLYFAFHCFDDQPEKIRTTFTRRDNSFNDDWVGLSLD